MTNERRQKAIVVYCKVALDRMRQAVDHANEGAFPSCETDIDQVIAVLELARDRFAEIYAESVLGDEG